MSVVAIACHPNLFTRQQEIFAVTESHGAHPLVTVESSNLSDALATTCIASNVYTIKLFGEENYVNPIAAEVYNLFNLKYSNFSNSLKVEVNNNEVFN